MSNDPSGSRPLQPADPPASTGDERAPRRWWTTGWARGSLIAASLLLAGAVIMNRTPGVPEAPGVGVASAGSDASLIHRVSILKPKVGMRLRAGDHITGTCRLEWQDGTTLTAEAGTDLEIGPGPGIALHLVIGSVRLEVRPQPAARPLTIRTQHGSLAAIDARFALAVTPEDSRLTAEQGLIAFRSIDGSPAVRVTDGMQCVTAGRGPPTALTPPSQRNNAR